MKITLCCFFFFLKSSVAITQFFYFNNQNDTRTFFIELTDWRNLDINDFDNYIEKNNLKFINQKENGKRLILTCQKDEPNQIISLSFFFENKVIIGLNKTTKFFLPNLSSISSSLDSDIFSETKRIAQIHDSNVFILFSKCSNQTMRFSNDLFVLVDSSKKTLHYENFYRYSNMNIYRKSILYDKGINFEILQSEQVLLPSEKYIVSGLDLQTINSNDINGMVKVFLNDARLNGLSFKEGIIKVEFSKLEDGMLGLSKGMNNDSIVHVLIDRDNWSISSPPHRWYVLYHELGHDILNLEHGKGGRMMNPISDIGYSWSEFWEDRQDMFLNYLLK
jgi:hypothetical protein